MYMYMYVYIYTYIHICIYTYMYTLNVGYTMNVELMFESGYQYRERKKKENEREIRLSQESARCSIDCTKALSGCLLRTGTKRNGKNGTQKESERLDLLKSHLVTQLTIQKISVKLTFVNGYQATT